jgi:exosortase
MVVPEMSASGHVAFETRRSRTILCPSAACGRMSCGQNRVAKLQVTLLLANSKRWLLYALWVGASLIVFWRPLGSLVRLAAENDDASHIFLIPFISAGLIFVERRGIFRRTSFDLRTFSLLVLAATSIGAVVVRSRDSWSLSETLAGYTLALVLLWIAGFALLFGRETVRAARFSVLLLLLAVPLPDFLLSHAVYYLQRGSAEVVAGLFDLTGVPYLREGFVFRLSRVSIEIAEECSGIRSSMAVLILALLAAHFYLHSLWRQSFFIVSSLVIMIVKNGVRIATLTLLSLYVSPSFLFGKLHRDGGVVFFLLGLAFLAPILWVLKRSEAPGVKDVSVSAPKRA